MSLPRILCVTEKWAECDPSHGLSNVHHNFIGSLKSCGLGYVDTFFFDEVAHQTKQRCDAHLLEYCRARPAQMIFLTMVRGTDLNPAPETLARIGDDLGIPIVSAYFDTTDAYAIEWIDTYAPFVDVNVIVDCYSNYAANGAWPDKFLPTWTPQDPDLYQEGKGARPIDVSFLGSVRVYPGRKLALGMLADAGIEVRQGGGQIEGGLPPQDYAGIFRQSRITINFSGPALDGPGNQCKGRVIEATLSGALLMEESNRETEMWFTPGVHYAAFTDERDLVEQVRHYLAHEEARAKIAAAGAAHARANYSAEAFWRRVLARALPAWEIGGSA
ncbi:MAG: glycosyltransferase [Rhodospirillales bacterium]|jgi:hypothetical protein